VRSASGTQGKMSMNMNRTAARRTLVRSMAVAVAMISLSAASFAQVAVGISVRIGPPALPVYAQPICPGPGYYWTPGYWAWNDDSGYYWVPGTWVVAPVGMLWTPGYWGFAGGFYGWHAGYWGPHIGFYGGINYGFGYGGVGFAGGEWRGGAFFYNRSVTNISATNVTNVYNKTVVVNENHAAFNGQGGVTARATPQEEAAAREHHTAPLAEQTQHEHLASQNKANFASENHGRPAVAATAKAGDFGSRSAVPARSAGAEYHAPAMSPKQARVASPPANKGNAGNAGRSNEAKSSGGKPSGSKSNAGKSNEGFRPFSQPSKTAASGNNKSHTPSSSPAPSHSSSHPQSQPKANASRPNASRPSAPRTTGARPSAPRSSPPPRRPSAPPRGR
jgi:WXXGXW repeat (2 copies)